MLLVNGVELLPDLSTDWILSVVSTLDSFQRVLEDPQEGSHTLPGIINHLRISIGNTRTKFLQFFLGGFLLGLDFLEDLRHLRLDLLVENRGQLLGQRLSAPQFRRQRGVDGTSGEVFLL